MKTTTYPSSLYKHIESPTELQMGLQVFLCYGYQYWPITIRKRVTKANYNWLKNFNYPMGYLNEETEEQYREYKDFLKRRVKNKQIFIKI